MSGPVFEIYIVRHGETEENRCGIIQGHLDTHLNGEGIRQAELVAHALRAAGPFSAAFSSDLSRAAKTAEIILAQQPADSPALVTSEALRERHMGDLQGQPAGIVASAESMESPAALAVRAMAWWKDTIERRLQSAAHSIPVPDRVAGMILVVSHGGFIGVLMRELIGSRKLVCAPGVHLGRCLNTSVTLLELPIGASKGVVVKYADVSHLESGEAVATNVDEQQSV